MAILNRGKIRNIISLGPLILLYILSVTELNFNHILYLDFFTFNIKAMLVYFWTLKYPQVMGTGHIFLASLINDVVVGLPLGTTPLTFLILALVATYIRNATISPSMTSDWISFIPAISFSYLINFIIIAKFSSLSILYLELLRNAFFTFLFFPIFYYFLSIYLKKIEVNA